ncbi:MAG: flagellar basal body P-ring protein FlgI [Terracidiphilus sp.]
MKAAFTIAKATHILFALAILALCIGASVLAPLARAVDTNRQAMIRDITTVQGVRDNPLVGYGLVVGLHGTGDTQQTIFTVQTLANAMQKMGVLINPSTVVVKNVAAVFVTASLPPFARPGAKLDVTVGSVGDARSLEGGVLLMSALHGPDGQIYAEAQGPLLLGGYSAGSGANRKEVNAANTATIPNGAIIERDTAVDLSEFKTVSLLLNNPDFTTATDIATAVNSEFGKKVATALDSRRVDISVADSSPQSVPLLIARVQGLMLNVHTPAKIIVNERTGTIVMGGNVKLSPVSVIHGTLSIQVVTTYTAAQPGMLPIAPPGFAPNGQAGIAGSPSGIPQPGLPQTGLPQQGLPQQGLPQPVLVPQTNVDVSDGPAESMKLDEGANVDELVSGLHAIGTTARDVVAILQAIKAEGGMQADLEVQ